MHKIIQSWAFRVSSRVADGAGHVKRCLSLAKELQRRGINISFILDEYNKQVNELIESFGMSTYLENDINLNDKIWDGVVIDGYGFKDNDISFWSEHSKTTVMISDGGKFNMTNDLVDFVINPSANIRLDDTIPDDAVPKVLSGKDYYLVDKDFKDVSYSIKKDNAKSILVSCGYVDTKCANAFVVEALTSEDLHGDKFIINVAVGHNTPCIENLKLLENQNENVTIHFCEGMIELLGKADIVIGGGGVSLLERIAYGIPSITIIVADNQEAQVEWADEYGATVNAGIFEALKSNSLKNLVVDMSASYKFRKEMSINARQLIDGLGVGKIANEIVCH